VKIQALAQKLDIGLAEHGNLELITFLYIIGIAMAQIDEIEDIMMEAYSYGIQRDVFELVYKLLPLYPHEPIRAYEHAFQQLKPAVD
jgi:hypothetical protein